MSEALPEAFFIYPLIRYLGVIQIFGNTASQSNTNTDCYNMKFFKVIQWCAICVATFLTGCADDVADVISDGEYKAGSIVLRLKAGGDAAVTKTQLTGSYNLHNVREVYAVLYGGEGDDATYICHQDLNWNPRMEDGYGDGIIQQKDVEFSISSALTDGKYTILCVGLDDCSGDAYSLKPEGENVLAFCREGAKLSQARAILGSGKTMKYSELFAGCQSFDYTADKVNEVNVEMRRRVAGVYAYLKDIPLAINGKDVKYIRLVTENTPTSEIGLPSRPAADGKFPEDYGSGAQDESAKVLDILEMATIATAGENNLYNIKKEYTEGLGLLPNTLLLSSYMIPMAKGEGNTFCIELLDASQSVIKSFPAIWSEVPAGMDAQRYPVLPDYIYHIGTRDMEGERPVSLAGYRLVISIQEWIPMDHHVDFSKVRLDAVIDPDSKKGSSYIYESINSNETIVITPGLLKKDWNLTILPEDKEGEIDPNGNCNWLYFKLPDGTYSQEVYSKDYEGWKDSEVNIVVLMNDFVEERDIDVEYNPALPSGREAINKDYRCARVVLQADESNSKDHLSFKQYNTITVKGQYVYGAIKRDFKCGFSRYDMGTKRDNNGAILEQGSTHGWGFWNSAFFQVHQPFTYDSPDCEPCYDGEICYISAARNDKGFPKSIIDISRCESTEWDGKDNITGDHFWYIPSQLELYAFFNSIARYDDIESHIVPGALYWSGTAYCDARILDYRLRSYCQKTTEIGKDTYALRQDNYGYVRRARKFK